MFGAIQYASGNDLSSLRGTLTERDVAIQNNPTVNRAAKGDRAMASGKFDQGQTLSFQVHGLTDTFVLLRLAGPVPKQQAASSKLISSEPRKATVACEPPVSLLTDVAKVLQPGRCVT